MLPKLMCRTTGLSEDRKNFISFPINTNIKTGDIVKAASETYLIKEICIDTYEGVPELIQAYF